MNLFFQGAPPHSVRGRRLTGCANAHPLATLVEPPFSRPFQAACASRKGLALLCFMLGFAVVVNAQKPAPVKPTDKEKDKHPAQVLITPSYAFQVPFADMAKRFSNNNNFGLQCVVITPKLWMFGASGDYMFGETVKEDPLHDLRTSTGYLIDLDGYLQFPLLTERGFSVSAQVGKLIPLGKKNRRSGIDLTFGAGYMEHRIKINDRSGRMQQIAGNYAQGYDRLSGGFALKQFIGYRMLSENRFTNFYAGIELTQGLTSSLRSWDYDRNAAGETGRFDMLVGFRVGWTLPIDILTAKTGKRKYY